MQIVSDGGSDVKKGAALFSQRHPETTVTYDAAHHGAIVLKRRFENDPQWSEFIGRLGQVKSRIRQTIDAFLASPSLRPKARYMNLESLLKWSRRILELLDRDASGGQRLPASVPSCVMVGYATIVCRSRMVALGSNGARECVVCANAWSVGG